MRFIVKVVFEFNRDGSLPSLFLYSAFTLPQPLATPGDMSIDGRLID
jgi:hypothetical protein